MNMAIAAGQVPSSVCRVQDPKQGMVPESG